MADILSGMGRPKKAEPTVPIRLPESFAKKLRRLALEAGVDPGDYLVTKFGDSLDRHYAKMVEELAKQVRKDGE